MINGRSGSDICFRDISDICSSSLCNGSVGNSIGSAGARNSIGSAGAVCITTITTTIYPDPRIG
eukprot:scaffold3685_cov68-Skeletonema_marinoi.AAC.1